MSQKENRRYLIAKFHAKSLEGNLLGSPTDRKLAIYLPPNYYKDDSTRYPEIFISI